MSKKTIKQEIQEALEDEEYIRKYSNLKHIDDSDIYWEAYLNEKRKEEEKCLEDEDEEFYWNYGDVLDEDFYDDDESDWNLRNYEFYFPDGIWKPIGNWQHE